MNISAQVTVIGKVEAMIVGSDTLEAEAISSEMAKLRWQCRRGIKEIEILINPFFESHYAKLNSAKRADFAELLTASDAELFAWFMGYERPSSERRAAMIDTIQSALQSKI